MLLQMAKFHSFLWLNSIPFIYVPHLIYPRVYKWPNFIPFNGWVIFHWIYVPHLPHPFLCRWAFRLFPCPDYCEQFLLVFVHFESLVPDTRQGLRYVLSGSVHVPALSQSLGMQQEEDRAPALRNAGTWGGLGRQTIRITVNRRWRGRKQGLFLQGTGELPGEAGGLEHSEQVHRTDRWTLLSVPSACVTYTGNNLSWKQRKKSPENHKQWAGWLTYAFIRLVLH